MATEINLTPTASYIEVPGGYRQPVNGKHEAAQDPARVPARTWGTPSECVAGALLVHGLGAHSGWFEALGRRLKVRRIFALAYDQVGFGKRRSQQFHSQEQWYSDLVTCYRHLSKMVGDKPVYIMGNSMGAAVALKVVADKSVSPAGLVMFSPGFDGHPQIFTLGYRLSTVLHALLRPEDEITLPYTPDMVTRTEGVRTWITKDPDRRFSPTGRMLLGVLKLSFELPKIKAVDCPLFMFTAGVDRIVDGKISAKIFQRLTAPSKKQHQFQEAWHDLMFDPVIDDLIDEIANWVSSTSSLQPEKQR